MGTVILTMLLNSGLTHNFVNVTAAESESIVF
jgi:hypothetical protein